jgi:hypothetical protein
MARPMSSVCPRCARLGVFCDVLHQRVSFVAALQLGICRLHGLRSTCRSVLSAIQSHPIQVASGRCPDGSGSDWPPVRWGPVVALGDVSWLASARHWHYSVLRTSYTTWRRPAGSVGKLLAPFKLAVGFRVWRVCVWRLFRPFCPLSPFELAVRFTASGVVVTVLVPRVWHDRTSRCASHSSVPARICRARVSRQVRRADLAAVALAEAPDTVMPSLASVSRSACALSDWLFLFPRLLLPPRRRSALQKGGLLDRRQAVQRCWWSVIRPRDVYVLVVTDFLSPIPIFW